MAGRRAGVTGRGRRLRPSALPVRTKAVLSVLLLSALGLAVAWAVTDTIHARAVLERIDGELDQEVEEFRVLAERGVDPDTGEPFSSVEQLLRVAIERNVPGADEMLVTFVGGDADLYSPSWASAVVDDPDLVGLVGDLGPQARSAVEERIPTAVGEMHVIAVPVQVADGSEHGTYVVGVGTDLALASQQELRRTFALVSLGTLVLVGAVAWWVVGRLLRPLELLAATAQRVGGDDLTLRAPVHGEDDVATLGRAFNTMLDRVAAAFDAQRQFLDDAGHELRTPLTVLRGHLELLEPDDPHDVAETRALLLDETARMSRIVEDLVLLAKSERPDFVRFGEVDLGPLTDDLLDKARALGDRAWRVDARAEGVVPGDEQRLTEAVLQLADNAVRFSRPGTRIAVGSAVTGSTARLWVRDEGPGVAPQDRERIFERFVRVGDADVPGSGLGLAIVAAVAHGHGGTVTAEAGSPASDGVGEHGLRVTVSWPVAGGPVGGVREGTVR
ncbi:MULTISPECIES: cell wall metabolism sensor histidine kinase WalK [Isoptericola]|uniref:histidine kinase n=1 Tax=Isoptericola sediminis TaxID=2733572 RepID=A0A849K293_9MICO|nr:MULTISPECIES: HAMP domain-containing sensor histidine kinase [Isoptericola]MDO8145693.1 HAMP domain-containing sensor histidine kinase [Isoptericola sp. 178]NNU28844.1 HAMP domain-containing histidine kinase [Isoptericola sediminis]